MDCLDCSVIKQWKITFQSIWGRGDGSYSGHLGHAKKLNLDQFDKATFVYLPMADRESGKPV